ncbi:HDOD domain-containing protein [bacterium]|nr:HDOD domain-containing protein [bacterium]
MERSVLDTIKNIEEIPTLPMVAMEVMSLSKTPNVSIKAISECIHKDPPLATKVLKLANSAFYRRGNQEIDTLHRAILLMGLNEIINITTTVSVLSIMGIKDRKSESLRIRLWDHSVATGLIARYIDKKLMMKSQGREFVGGLLHDIGKIILDEFFHDKFMEAHTLSLQKSCNMYEAEQEVLGTNHMEVGHFLAQKWGLPPYIADITLHHHNPAQSQHKDITSLVSIANLLAKAKELSCGGDTVSFVLRDQEGWIILRKMGYPVDALDIERITFEMEDIGKEVKSYISTVAEEPGGETANG